MPMSFSGKTSVGKCPKVEPLDPKRFKRVEVNALHQPILGSNANGGQQTHASTA
jgi:hypothetical protein